MHTDSPEYEDDFSRPPVPEELIEAEERRNIARLWSEISALSPEEEALANRMTYEACSREVELAKEKGRM